MSDIRIGFRAAVGVCRKCQSEHRLVFMSKNSLFEYSLYPKCSHCYCDRFDEVSDVPLDDLPSATLRDLFALRRSILNA